MIYDHFEATKVQGSDVPIVHAQFTSKGHPKAMHFMCSKKLTNKKPEIFSKGISTS